MYLAQRWLRKLIGWFGEAFMAGSGYEKRLHEELTKMRKAQEVTIILLKNIEAILKG